MVYTYIKYLFMHMFGGESWSRLNGSTKASIEEEVE
jgi:hypothetical protein